LTAIDGFLTLSENRTMIQLEFTEAEIKALETERFTHPDPKVQRRMETLYLKSLNLPHYLIRRICRLSEPALVRALRTYAQEGLAGLKQNHYRGQPSVLGQHATSLEAYLRQHPPSTSAQAQQMIEEHTGVRRSPTQIRAFLHRLGMKYRKTGFVPGKADTPEKQAEQAEYVKKNSNRRFPKPKRGSGWFFSWMPLILSILSIWGFCGVSAEFFCDPRPVANGSMC
jgi:transposase